MDAYQLKRARDKFLKERKTLGLISRGYFKIEEIDKHFNLIKTNHKVLDLGAAPGGWCQYIVGKTKNITAIDILPMSIPNIKFIKTSIFNFICEDFFDVIVCDIAPNISGIKETDNYNIMKIAYRFLEIVKTNLIKKGSAVIKLFYNSETESYKKLFSNYFEYIKEFKPKSSYKESKEFYLIGLDFKQ